MSRTGYLFFPLLLALLLSGCSGYQKLLKSEDTKLKLKMADQYFNEGKYDKAAGLYESSLTFIQGAPEYEEVYYKTGVSHFKMRDYAIASQEFRYFIEAFPASRFLEDAMYYYAYGLYLDAPGPKLDQSSTQTAIAAFQIFLDRFPTTTRADEINGYIDILRGRLEKKAVNNALIYYKIENYQAAVWALRNLIQEYPGVKDRERIEYLIVESSYKYAMNSVEGKKLERLYSAMQSYREFTEHYPSSKFAGEAAVIRISIEKELNTLKTQKL